MKKNISAEVNEYNNIYYLRAYSTTVDGVRYAADNPIYTVSAEEVQHLGPQILEVFKDCKQGIPHPDFSLPQPKDKMLTAMGLKTDKALMKKARSLCVYHEKDKIEVHPFYFNGSYLTGDDSLDLECSLDPDDITATVLKAFERCHPPKK